MKIGIVSDSLANLPFEACLDAATELGIEGVEVNTGNWSSAPHLDLDLLVESAGARREFLRAFERRGLTLAALNANGNQLHPVDGARQAETVDRTVRLAGMLGVDKVCLMSGLPGAAPGETTPNWIVSAWPPETGRFLRWQWQERLVPYWEALVKNAEANGVTRLCIELHGNQLVYNVPSLIRLREAVGPRVGANLDPSHLMWMGADPLAAIDALGGAVYHVHAKDTWINPATVSTVSVLDTAPMERSADRAWNYITLGYGHGESWWRKFCYRLQLAGYDGWLSIEHEDVALSRIEGVRRSVALLQAVAPVEDSDYAPQPM